VSPAGCCHRGESGGGGFRRGGSVLRPLRMHAIHPVRVIRTFRSGTSACAQNTGLSCGRASSLPPRGRQLQPIVRRLAEFTWVASFHS
jgi:hypothetical protein